MLKKELLLKAETGTWGSFSPLNLACVGSACQKRTPFVLLVLCWALGPGEGSPGCKECSGPEASQSAKKLWLQEWRKPSVQAGQGDVLGMPGMGWFPARERAHCLEGAVGFSGQCQTDGHCLCCVILAKPLPIPSVSHLNCSISVQISSCCHFHPLISMSGLIPSLLV